MKNYTEKQRQQRANAEKLLLLIGSDALLLWMIWFCASFQAVTEVIFLSIVLIAFNFLFIALTVEAKE